MALSPASIKMIDIAANLTDAMFKGFYNGKQAHPADIAAVLARAWETGVERIIVTGGSLEESREALALADTDARLYCTVGVHPTRCKEFVDSGDPDGHLEKLRQLAEEGRARGKVVAIGECGLDYDRLQFCDADTQKKYFEAQFSLAESTQLPMFLHMRAAASDFCEIVHRNYTRFKAGVSHSFTGTEEELRMLLAIDKIYIGINGCSLKTDENLQVAARVPLNRLMIETDAPYCDIRSTHAGSKFVKTTWPSRRKEKHEGTSMIKGRNEPCTVRQVLEVVAEAKEEAEVAEVARCILETTCKVFFPQDLDTMAGVVLASAAAP